MSAGIRRGNLLHINEIKTHLNALRDVYQSDGLFAHTWLAGGLTDDYTALQKELNDAGYEMGQHHYRNDRYTVFGGRVTDCPVMDEIESKYFFVPFHWDVSVEDAHNIGKICQKYL